MTDYQASQRKGKLGLSIFTARKRSPPWYFLGLTMAATGVWLMALHYAPGRFLLYGFVLWLILNLSLNLRLLFFTLGICLVLMETGFRGYAIYLDARYPTNSAESILWEYDPLLGWKNAAGQEGEFIRKENFTRSRVKINSVGLRDDEYNLLKPPGTRRILLLGDSVTVGFEVDKKHVIDTRLESLLASEGQFEVINGGVRGYGTDQSYLFLKETGLQFLPDIIIYIFVNNDTMGNVTIHRPNRKFGKAYFRVDQDGKPVLYGVPVPRFFEPGDQWIMSDPDVEDYFNKHQRHKRREKKNQDQGQKNLSDLLKQDLSHFHATSALKDLVRRNRVLAPILMHFGVIANKLPEDIPQTVKDYQWRVTEALVDAMAKEAQRAGARFLVYEFTSTGTDKVGKQIEQPTALQEVCERLEISYLNSFRLFYEKSGGKLRFRFPNDGHWNALGHDLGAQDIYRYLVESGWLN
jgi:lysophospholipase L1-like esterase